MLPRVRPDAAEQAWLAQAGEVQRVTLPLVPGSLWRFAGFALPTPADKPQRWFVRPGLYRVVGVGRQVRTGQELVAHCGVGGPDDGKLYFCPLGSWVQFFTPE